MDGWMDGWNNKHNEVGSRVKPNLHQKSVTWENFCLCLVLQADDNVD